MWGLNTIKKTNTDEQILKRIRYARRMNRVRKLARDEKTKTKN